MTSTEKLVEIIKNSVVENAELNGWIVKKINNKQIEITKKANYIDDYDKICCDLIINALS